MRWFGTAAVVLALAAPAPVIEGTDLADFLAGTPRADQVLGKAGDDVVFCLGGAVWECGRGGEGGRDGGRGTGGYHGDGVCRPNAVRPDECNDEDDRSGD